MLSSRSRRCAPGRLNTFLQNIVRARRLLAECLRKRGIDLALELS
jgi:hypothetical protein